MINSGKERRFLMKKIINNKIYDTSKATELVRLCKNVVHTVWVYDFASSHSAIIYKTNKGTYFEYVGPNNNYPDYETLDLLTK